MLFVIDRCLLLVVICCLSFVVRYFMYVDCSFFVVGLFVLCCVMLFVWR